MTSGDESDTTNEIEDFIPLYGDFHAYNRFGDLDWVDTGFGPHNITDYNIGYEHWFGDAHYVMFAYHMFTDTEPSRRVEDHIGDEIDLTYDFNYSKNVSFEVTLGEAMPEDAYWFGPGGVADPVDRLTAMVLFRY